MVDLKNNLIYRKYISELLNNQNMSSAPYLQDVYSYQDYDRLLKPVLRVLEENPFANLTTLRFLLFKQSGLEEIINNFVHQTKITPGIILDFGTLKTRDTVLCGLSQEYDFINGEVKHSEKPMEQDTIFDLASTSKLFTVIAVLKLEEFGLLDVFDPVKKYVPEFKNLDDVSIYDLLKFRVAIGTDARVDSAKTKEEAEQILFTVHKRDNQMLKFAYTDMGAMVLRYVVERVSKMPFTRFVDTTILKPTKMHDTYLNVPDHKLNRVANENFSSIVLEDGTVKTKYDTFPGIQHDAKALAIGAQDGIAPGHAGYFSTKDDMVKLGNALINGSIISKNKVLSMSDTASGFKDEDGFTMFFGSLVYLKQADSKYLSVYPPLSGKSFMSPGFAGTTLVVDPINEITLFVGANRLHNRIYQVHPSQTGNIKVDEHNMKTFKLPNGEEKIVSSDYIKAKEVMVTLALDLALQYQLLEKIKPTQKEMHLVRELN